MKVLVLLLASCILTSYCVSIPPNTFPEYNLCVNDGDLFSCSGHGMCKGGNCVCTPGYSGRDCSIPDGGFNYPRPATVTYFCDLSLNGCSPGMCIGGGTFTGANLPDGVTGIAAVNPTIYGSRYAYAKGKFAIDRTLNGAYSNVGQACGTCWKLTAGSVSITVTVVDRCAGYCRADANRKCDANSKIGEQECGMCIALNQPSVPQCSCQSPDSTKSPNLFCYGNNGVLCDWCANNDHPHFDLDQASFNTLCADKAKQGHCTVDTFQMVDCGRLKGPWPNGYYNSTTA